MHLSQQDLENEVEFYATRSRGPGGQNVNKVSSAALLVWNFYGSAFLTEEQRFLIRTKLSAYINKEGQLFLRSDEFRDLPRNKARCLEKLLQLLERAFSKPKERKATRPTRSSKERRLQSKGKHSDIKKSRQKIKM